MAWKGDLCPPGAAKATVLADKKTPIASYVSAEAKERIKETVVKHGLGSPFKWYKVVLSGLAVEEDKGEYLIRLSIACCSRESQGSLTSASSSPFRSSTLAGRRTVSIHLRLR